MKSGARVLLLYSLLFIVLFISIQSNHKSKNKNKCYNAWGWRIACPPAPPVVYTPPPPPSPNDPDYQAGNISGFDTLKSYQIPDGGEKIYYRQLRGNTEKTFLFLHGIVGSAQMLNTGGLLSSINSFMMDYRIIAMDLPGNGDSTLNSVYNTYTTTDPAFVSVLCQVIADFLIGLQVQSVVLMGTDYGGLVATTFAALYPDKVNGLILDGTIGPEGAMHLFADIANEVQLNDPPTVYTIDDIKITDPEDYLFSGFYTILNGCLNDPVDKKACFSQIFGDIQPLMVNSQNYSKLADDMVKTRNLFTMCFSELTTNLISDINAIGVARTKNDNANILLSAITSNILIIHGLGDQWVPVESVEKLASVFSSTTQVTLAKLGILVGHYTWYDDLTNTVLLINNFIKNKVT